MRVAHFFDMLISIVSVTTAHRTSHHFHYIVPSLAGGITTVREHGLEGMLKPADIIQHTCNYSIVYIGHAIGAVAAAAGIGAIVDIYYHTKK